MSRKKNKIAVASEEETAQYAPDAAAAESEKPEAVEPSTPAQRIEQLEAERAELKDRLLRAQAECANISRRLNQQHAASLKMAGMALARALLPVMDSFERTLGVLDEARENDGGRDNPVAEGVRLIAEEFRKTLREQGIVPFEVAGEAFDPTRHEAMMQDTGADAPAGTVTRVFQPGYMMHDRVLRPAKVAVAAAVENDAADVDAAEEAAPSDES